MIQKLSTPDIEITKQGDEVDKPHYKVELSSPNTKQNSRDEPNSKSVIKIFELATESADHKTESSGKG